MEYWEFILIATMIVSGTMAASLGISLIINEKDADDNE